MIAGKNVRLLAILVHVMSSVGWMGSIAAFLLFSIKGEAASDPAAISMCAESMRLIGWSLVVPFCIAGLASGIVISLITRWGLVRHYWIVVKWVLMVAATALLFLHMNAVDELAERPLRSAASAVFSSLTFDAAAALVLVGLLTALSFYKPAGQVWVAD